VPSEDKPDGRAATRRTELLWRNEASDTEADGGESVCAGEELLLFPQPLCYGRYIACQGNSFQMAQSETNPQLTERLWNNSFKR